MLLWGLVFIPPPQGKHINFFLLWHALYKLLLFRYTVVLIMTTVWWLLFYENFFQNFFNHQKEHKDSGYETPLNSPTKLESESTSEESIELNKNEVFIDSDADNDEVRSFGGHPTEL